MGTDMLSEILFLADAGIIAGARDHDGNFAVEIKTNNPTIESDVAFNRRSLRLKRQYGENWPGMILKRSNNRKALRQNGKKFLKQKGEDTKTDNK